MLVVLGAARLAAKTSTFIMDLRKISEGVSHIVISALAYSWQATEAEVLNIFNASINEPRYALACCLPRPGSLPWRFSSFLLSSLRVAEPLRILESRTRPRR